MLKQLHNDICDAVTIIKPQLGYLLLTGSSENYIRDTFAFYLNEKGACVGRDYRIRDKSGKLHIVDIVELTDGSISKCIELKQLYIKNITDKGHTYLKNILRDLQARKRLCKNTYGVILVRDVSSNPDSEREKIMTYVADDIKKRQRGIGWMNNVIMSELGVGNVYPSLEDNALIADVSEQGVDVRLYSWVIQLTNTDNVT